MEKTHEGQCGLAAGKRRMTNSICGQMALSHVSCVFCCPLLLQLSHFVLFSQPWLLAFFVPYDMLDGVFR
jgi:hypothetical protein